MSDYWFLEHIELRPGNGRAEPVFRGTDIRVADFLETMGESGATPDEMIAPGGAWHRLTKLHVQAAQAYAAAVIAGLDIFYGSALDEARELFDRGCAELQEGDAGAAIATLNRSWRIEPHWKTAQQIGLAWRALGDRNQALLYLSAAAVLSPNARPASLAGEVLCDLGRLDDAVKLANLALSRNQECGPARRLLDRIEAERRHRSRGLDNDER